MGRKRKIIKYSPEKMGAVRPEVLELVKPSLPASLLKVLLERCLENNSIFSKLETRILVATIMHIDFLTEEMNLTVFERVSKRSEARRKALELVHEVNSRYPPYEGMSVLSMQKRMEYTTVYRLLKDNHLI